MCFGVVVRCFTKLYTNRLMSRNEQNVIPRIIHQIWFQGKDSVPRKYVDNTQELVLLNPGFSYQFWDDTCLQLACSQLGEHVLARYKSFPHMHQKIDFGRYVVLYIHGGISIDMDVKALRPLSEIPGLGTGDEVIVCEAPVRGLELACYSMGHFTSMLNNAMIAAPPRSPAMAQLVSDVVRARTKAWGRMYQIQWTTGPFMFTKSLRKSIASGVSVKVLEAWYFEPCYVHDMHCTVHPDAILDHQHGTSWVGNGWIVLSKVYYTLKPYLALLLCLLLLVVASSYKVMFN